MARSSGTRWLVACAGAALLLIALVVWMARTTAERRRGAAPAGTNELACPVPVPELRPAHPDADHPPLILWAAGKVRLFVDGAPTFSPPESPKRFSPGEHVLKVEVEGRRPVVTRFRLRAWEPALVHAEDDPEVGLTIVQLGSVCVSCVPSVTPVTELTGSRTRDDTPTLLRDAAEGLRHDDWRTAIDALGSVRPADRSSRLYLRLSSAAWRGAAVAGRALEAARRVPDPELARLIARWEALEKTEQARYGEILVARWNRLTEQHAALLRAVPELLTESGGDGEKMEALSGQFNQAGTDLDRARVYQEAWAIVRGLVQRLGERAKDDCELRTRIATALAGSAP